MTDSKGTESEGRIESENKREGEQAKVWSPSKNQFTRRKGECGGGEDGKRVVGARRHRVAEVKKVVSLLRPYAVRLAGRQRTMAG